MRPSTLTLRLAFALALVAATAAAQAQLDDPERWYRESYAVLWQDSPGDRLPGMVDHYFDTVRIHRSDGAVSDQPAEAWLGDALVEWAAEGWLRAELTGLLVDRINDGAASFRARWADHYADGSMEESCGWYLAARRGDTWAFTAYADLDCAVQGF